MGVGLKNLIKSLILSIFIANIVISPAISKEKEKSIVEYSFLEIYEKQKGILDKFDELYPGAKINVPFFKELHEENPKKTVQTLEKESSKIRFWIKLRRQINKFMIEKVTKESSVPDPALSAEAFQDGYKKGDFNSIKSRDNKQQKYVVKDFKRHVPYDFDKEVINTIVTEANKDDDEKKDFDNDLDKLLNSVSKLEIKKLPFYGLSSENPITNGRGVGRWNKDENMGFRIVSSHTNIDKDVDDFIFGIDFILYNTKIFWYGNNSGGMSPKITWEKLDNIEIEEVFWPIPKRYIGKKDIIAYSDLMIPIKAKIIDKTKPVYIKAKIEASSCKNNKCNYFEKSGELKIDTGKSLITPYDIYLKLYKAKSPVEKKSDYQISDILLEKNSNGVNQLKIKIKTENKAKKLDVFVNSNDGLKFGRPRIAVEDGVSIARLDILSGDKNILGKKIEVVARINNNIFLHKTSKIKENNLFDLSSQGFTLAIIIAAFIGGFFLNFMPCVLPVIVLKILSISKYDSFENKSPKTNVLYTILGLYSSFLLLVLITSIMKYLGHSIGWGMQFQNPLFLIFMMLILIVFMANVFGVFEFKTPEFINDISAKFFKNDKIESFFTGFLLTLLATPCTAPYLGSAVAFALSRGFIEIFVIFMAIATGLSIPFWLILIGKNNYYLDNPEKKIKTVKYFMNLLLLLTFIWIASIFYAQAGFFPTVRISSAMVLLVYIWWLSETAKIESYDVSEEKDILSRALYNQRIKKFMNLFAVISTIIILSSISYDAVKSFEKDDIAQEKIYENWNKFEPEKIEKIINDNKIVLVNIGADWCLTCELNDATVFSYNRFKNMTNKDDIVLMKADWNKFDKKIINFIEKYGRKSIPFYMVFGKRIPTGIILPELLSINVIEEAFSESRYKTTSSR